MATHSEYLAPYLSKDLKLDPSKLTVNLRSLLKFMMEVFPDVVEDSILLNIFSLLGQIGSYNKLSIRSNAIQGTTKTTFSNFYGITFMPSGEGKDKPLKFLTKDLAININKDFLQRRKEFMQHAENSIIDVAAEKFENGKVEREKYIEAHKPRMLTPVATDGTVEGLNAMRAAFEEAGFGGVTIRISEFGDYIKSSNNLHKDFLSILIEMYDDGDTKVKLTKGEKSAVEINGVPSNFLAHSSFFGLMEGEGNARLLEFFNRGLARRSFICYPESFKYLNPLDQADDALDRILFKTETSDPLKETGKFIELLDKCYESAKFSPIFTFDDDAELYSKIYTHFNQIRASKISVIAEEGFRAEQKNRHWKMMKLAGLIASFEHPEDFHVHLEDLGSAIYVSEYYTTHFQRFYRDKPQSGYDKMLLYFIENKDKWITKTMLREQNFVGQNGFAKWLPDAITDMDERVQEKGFRFKRERNGAKGEMYMVEDLNPIK